MKFTDQIGHTITLNSYPERIISLVPSQTELLFELGLGETVVGITKFCIHPQSWFTNKIRVGGTKNINFDALNQLKPDLIITNKEENTKEEVERLQKMYPVYTSNISNLSDSLDMISDLGQITNKENEALHISKKIRAEFTFLKNQKIELKKSLYLIWQNPYMTINKTRFISDMMKWCGFENVIESSLEYPEISDKEIIDLNPSFILLSSEPFPFKEKHKLALQSLCPSAKIILVDGEFFSWYGSRLILAPRYFSKLQRNCV